MNLVGGKGRRRRPRDAAPFLMTLIRAHIEAGRALAMELERYAATTFDGRTIPRGFCTVRPRDGIGSAPRDARGRSARNRPQLPPRTHKS